MAKVLFCIFYCVFFVVGAPRLAADSVESSDDGNEVVIKDYGVAIERLKKLGFPESKGARMVRLMLYERLDHWREGSVKVIDEKEFLDQDLAWLLPGQEGEDRTVLDQRYGVIRIREFRIKEGDRLTEGELLKVMNELPDGARLGCWEVMEEKEVREYFDGLFEMIVMADQVGIQKEIQKFYPIFFEHACYWYGAGYEDEVNDFLTKFFGMVESPVRVLDHLVNKLGDWRYQSVMESFERSHDWQELHSNLQRLISEFSRGWRLLEAVKILERRVGQRLRGPRPTPRDYKSHPLRPQAIAAVDRLFTLENKPKVHPQVYWVLGTEIDRVNDIYDYYGYNHERPAWMNDITDLGMDGYLALVSLLRDESLIPLMVNSFPSHEGDADKQWQDAAKLKNDEAEALALAQYEDMRRPVERGEIAYYILKMCMLGDVYGDEKISHEEFQNMTYQWWLKHRNDTRPALAQQFLAESLERKNRGDYGWIMSDETSVAIMAMIHFGTKENEIALESFFLQSGVNFFPMLEAYLKSRGGAARGFLKRYEFSLNDVLAYEGDDSNLKNSMKSLGGVGIYLKKLSVYIDELSTNDVLALMQDGEVLVQEGFLMLDASIGRWHSELGGQDASRYLPELVAMAQKQSDTRKQLVFLSALEGWVSDKVDGWFYGRKYEMMFTASRQMTLKKSKEDWRYFLRQDQPWNGKDLPESKLIDGAPSLAVYAAEMMEKIYFSSGDELNRIYSVKRVLDPLEYRAFLLKRAESLLADGQPVQWPSGDNVKKSRRASIRQSLVDLPAGEVVNFYQSLTLDEKMIWSEVLKSFEKEYPPSIRQWQNLVNAFYWVSGSFHEDLAQKKIYALILHKPFESSMIRRLVDVMVTDETLDPTRILSISPEMDGHSGLGVSSHVGARANQIREYCKLPSLTTGKMTGKVEKQKVVGIRFSVIGQKDDKKRVLNFRALQVNLWVNSGSGKSPSV